MEKLLYDSTEAALILGMSKKTLSRRIEDGEIKFIKKNSHYFFKPEYLESYVEKIEKEQLNKNNKN
jgi:excisionase family DNA binding protein